MSGVELDRHLAPLSDDAWERLESEARSVLRTHLAARRIVDFEGPLGWQHSAINLGRIGPLEHAGPREALVHQRIVRPLIELRVPFELNRSELRRVDRGAADIELDALREAARIFARAEDDAVFEGYPDVDMPGIISSATQEPVRLPRDGIHLPGVVSEALGRLRAAGVGGPYAAALGREAHAALDRAHGDGGYPVLRHVQQLIDGPVVWAPSLQGGVFVSLRGGDFRFVSGRDIAIGYLDHDATTVHLYIEESFGTELAGPEAAVPLLPATG